MYRRICGVYLKCLLSLALCFTAAVTAIAQLDTARISGVVQDAQNAVIANASVTLVSTDTGAKMSATTNNDGTFALPPVLPGHYTLQIERDGFTPYQVQDITLNVGDNRAVQVRLEVGGTSQSVTVSAEGQLLNDSGSLSNLTTEQELKNLPLISREDGNQRTQTFVLANPGVTYRSGWVAVDGGRKLDSTPTVDGMIVMSQIDAGGGSVVSSGMEGTQQVAVELAGSPAEYPRPAQYSTITKAGTNEFHGSAFESYNGSWINAKDYFATRVPTRVYNDAGISIGGPLQKNKTFGFLDWEHSRESIDVVITGDTALAPWRTGDFSGVSQPIINPYTNVPFLNNQIPASLISQVAQNVQNLYYPLPNYGASTLEAGNYRALMKPGQSDLTDFDSFDARLDHQFAPKDFAYASFNFTNMPFHSWTGGSLPPFGLRYSFRLARSGQGTWTHTFSPSLVNEARMGFTRQKNSIRSPYIGSDILNQVGIQGVSTLGIPTVPIMEVSGLTTANQVPSFFFPETSFQWVDNLTWTKGSHTPQFGFTLVHDQNTSMDATGSVYGTYDFTGAFTGFPYADFLLGLPQTTGLSTLTPESHRFGNWWNAYAQDQWKVTSKLTLDYGLRWEAQSPYSEKHDMLSSFDPATGSIVVPGDAISEINPLYPTNLPIETAAEAHYPSRTLLDFRKAYFYPRFGFAYTPFAGQNIVVRGSYGIYGNSIYGALGLTGGPFAGNESFTNKIVNGAPSFSFPNPFLQTGALPTQNITGVNPDLKVPYLQQWNLTIDKAFNTYAFSASYIGSKATNLIYSRNLNQPPSSTAPFVASEYTYPLFNSVTWADNGGNENYNSMQLSARKTLAKGLFFKAAWTWAKDLTDTQDETTYTGPVIQNAYDRRAEYGNAAQVSRHRVFLNALYNSPIGKGGHGGSQWNQVMLEAFADWGLALTFVGETGPYYTPQFTGFDPSNTNNFTGRPDVVAGVSTTPVGGHKVTQWFNPGAFKIPGCPDSQPLCTNPSDIGRFGNASVDSLEGPGYVDLDTALSRDFSLWEKVRMQVRISAQNVLNHENFSTPSNVDINSPTAGNITSSYSESAVSTARQVNFWVRFSF